MSKPVLSERIRPAILGGGGIITVNTEVAEQWADEAAQLEAKLDTIKRAARKDSELLRRFLGFGPSTELELLLADDQEEHDRV